jgi:hypothetical protein
LLELDAQETGAVDKAVEVVTPLCDNGAEVKGGGRVPFKSPLTLRLRGGSSKAPLSRLRLFVGASVVMP